MEDTVYVCCYLCHRPCNSTSLAMTPRGSEFLVAMGGTLRVRTVEERFLLDVVSQIGSVLVPFITARNSACVINMFLSLCWVLFLVLIQPFS